ncbi:MAG: ResB protein required for cytochrome C biosynthesis [Verrucomicrobia bacterium]|nr:MAG: ResB protein required for cytochrome C biosynthesis [Verrucomicrobiota bacterium]
MDAKSIVRALGSLRLTLVLLILAAVLVFVGTMAQVKLGIHAAQVRYFQSLFVYAELGGGLRVPVLPGGYLIGGLMVINLICAYATRIHRPRGRWGLLLVHAGLLMLLLGQFVTDLLQVESTMRLKEGQRLNYSQSSRKFELALIDLSDPDKDRVVAIPESVLQRQQVIRVPETPFTLRVLAYWPNSRPVQGGSDGRAPEVTQGQGRQFRFQPAPRTTRTDRRDIPTAYVEVLVEGEPIGTWCASGWYEAPDRLSHGGREYALWMRPARYYKPYYLKLIDFSHDRYLGTNIPKNFSSLVRIQNPQTGEDREVLIYMNHPLRYGGETYYQSGYDENDPTVTILQVVRNPGWLTPYVACLIVGIGMCMQFAGHLRRLFSRKQEVA